MSAPSSDGDQTAGRGPDGKFTAGNPGGPGRVPGVRNRVSVLLERVMAADGVAVAKALIEKAKAGDVAAGKVIIDRLLPIARGRPIALDLPEIERTADVLKAQAALVRAMGAGAITPEEAAVIAGVLEAQRRTIETVELEARLAAIEARMGEDRT